MTEGLLCSASTAVTVRELRGTPSTLKIRSPTLISVDAAELFSLIAVTKLSAFRPSPTLPSAFATVAVRVVTLGRWLLPLNFEESLRNTIQWTLDNPAWLDQEHFISMPGETGAVMPAMKPGYNVDAAIVEGNAKVAAMAKL